MKKLQTPIRTVQTVEITFQLKSQKNNLKKLNHCDALALKETLETFKIPKVSSVLHPMEELDTKEKILKAAEDLFTRYGVRSISMDDIARHLSVSKKTLYQHFADKDDLVTEVSNNHLLIQRGVYDQLRDESKNAIDHLSKVAVCMKKEMEDTNPSLLFDIEKYHPKAWAGWLKFKRGIINDIIENLTKGIEEGTIREDINPEILAIVRLELIQLAFNQEIFPKNKFKLAEVQTQIFDQFVFGVVTDKGRKLYLKYKNKSTPIINS